MEVSRIKTQGLVPLIYIPFSTVDRILLSPSCIRLRTGKQENTTLTTDCMQRSHSSRCPKNRSETIHGSICSPRWFPLHLTRSSSSTDPRHFLVWPHCDRLVSLASLAPSTSPGSSSFAMLDSLCTRDGFERKHGPVSNVSNEFSPLAPR